jgi:hypothetical protein
MVSARSEVALHFAPSVGRQRNGARLVELTGPNEEDVVVRIIVADRQAEQFAPAEPSGVEQDQRQAKHLSAEGRFARGGQPARRLEEARDLGRREDVGRPHLMRRGKAGRIRHEAVGLRSTTVQTEVTDDSQHIAADGRHQMLQGLRPARKPVPGQVGRAAPIGVEKRLERLQDPAFPGIAPA